MIRSEKCKSVKSNFLILIHLIILKQQHLNVIVMCSCFMNNALLVMSNALFVMSNTLFVMSNAFCFMNNAVFVMSNALS